MTGMTTRSWLLVAGGSLAFLIGLALVGNMLHQRAAALGEPVPEASLDVLRASALAAFVVLVACVPPLALRAFVRGQERAGNGAHPRVAYVREHEAGIVAGMLGVWVLGALIAGPAVWRDVRGGLRAESAERAALDALPAADRAAIVANTASPDDDVTTPGPGTPPRDAILDAVRARLGTTSRFRVDHVRMAHRWAFVRATEVVVDGDTEQETDLTVAAMLELREGHRRGEWDVREIWTLPTDDSLSLAEFTRRVRARQKTLRLPGALFPDDLAAR